MKTIEMSAKNVQKAIELGLEELGVAQEDVDIKILEEGGLFRKAKVQLIYDDGVEEEPVKVEQNVEEQKPAEKKTKVVEQQKSANREDVEKFGIDFLNKLFEQMQITAEVTSFANESGITFNASGDKVGDLIGKRGETLNAIQEILGNVVRNAGFKGNKIYFDVENYKNRREVSLVALAERMAEKAKRYNKPVRLERMNAYERKIIHTTLQDVEGVTTKSEGEEPNRYLVVIPTDAE